MRGRALPAIGELQLRRSDPELQLEVAAAVPGAWPARRRSVSFNCAAGNRICSSRLPKAVPGSWPCTVDDQGAAAAPAGSGSAARGSRGRTWCVASAPVIEEQLLRWPDPLLQVAAAAAVPGSWPCTAGDQGAAAAPAGSA
ncbi:hypothetical protein RB620_24680 [Paenibacillus sp. LHD-117]|uniref:hypothetical protein n=1 Tax=Paenibacillus sp. LHD-117 TaxID=3071412 RepID=UPI0027E183A6|nr:hypothetical protein [Paenibacillus sp. LHD-117]MDQ6422633.1 hypothetical protein [Paenibacillus sp. LHD-117]